MARTCNGNNHSDNCRCPWGPGWKRTGASSGYFDWTSPVPKCESRNAETRATTCPFCGAIVYFHTNGNGDGVFFDELGPPWPRHGCFPKPTYSAEATFVQLSLVVPDPHMILRPPLEPGVAVGVVLPWSVEDEGPSVLEEAVLGGTSRNGLRLPGDWRFVGTGGCLVSVAISVEVRRDGERELVVDAVELCCAGAVVSAQRTCAACGRALLWSSRSSRRAVCHRCGHGDAAT